MSKSDEVERLLTGVRNCRGEVFCIGDRVIFRGGMGRLALALPGAHGVVTRHAIRNDDHIVAVTWDGSQKSWDYDVDELSHV